MDIELRPLRLAEILDRIFQLYRARFALFLGIAAVTTIVELLWNLINLGETRWMTSHHFSVTTRQWVSSVSTIPGWTFMFGAAALCLAASNRAVAAIYDGKPTSIVKAFAGLRSSWLRSIWVNTLAFLIAWGSIIVVLLAGIHGNGARDSRQNTGAGQLPSPWCMAEWAFWSCWHCPCACG